MDEMELIEFFLDPISEDEEVKDEGSGVEGGVAMHRDPVSRLSRPKSSMTWSQVSGRALGLEVTCRRRKFHLMNILGP